MKTNWQKACVKTIIWLAAEIILNLIGLDDLADYSEFLFEHDDFVNNGHYTNIVLVMPHPPHLQANLSALIG